MYLAITTDTTSRLKLDLLQDEVMMIQVAQSHPDQAELLEALVDAECEMHEVGSRLEMPGNIRFRLLQAAHRAQRLIEVAEGNGEPVPPESR